MIKVSSELNEIYAVSIGHNQSVKSVKIDVSSVVTGGMDGIVRVIGFEDGKTRHILRGHLYPISCLNLTEYDQSNDPKIMTADESGELRLWTLHSGRCQYILRQNLVYKSK